ncbi:class I ribonucleotide reductase maintenance protein YfaE [Buchnera aphidicola (Mollitrichosiphum nigrofasciatum)]|uniref:class I ribonucleotide reductase maintenance protein YfaE n=1 Tax=Buchnera aphidicola TaxID=9 RepID=UPI0031B84412
MNSNNLITIIQQNIQKKIINIKKQTLLKTLELNNIHVSYQCEKGYCGMCRVSLIKGSIKYINKEQLAILNPKEILTCCCIPITDIIIKI